MISVFIKRRSLNTEETCRREDYVKRHKEITVVRFDWSYAATRNIWGYQKLGEVRRDPFPTGFREGT